MMNKTLRVGLVLAMSSFPSSVLAVIVTQPSGLNPGDQYRLAFVTSTGGDATSANIADYNAFVTGAANSQLQLSVLGTTWTALGSTASVDAIDNTSTTGTGVPIYLLDGTKLVNNYLDLWDGDLDVPLSITEAGNVLNTFVWTGTYIDGAVASNPDGSFPLGFVNATLGMSSTTTGAWTSIGRSFWTDGHPYYGISGVLTVAAVPESSAFLCVGLVGVGFSAWKKLKTLRHG